MQQEYLMSSSPKMSIHSTFGCGHKFPGYLDMSLKVKKNCFGLVLMLPFMISNVWANEVSFPGTGNEVGAANELLVYPGIDSSELTYNLGKKRTFRIRYGDNIDIRLYKGKLAAEIKEKGE